VDPERFFFGSVFYFSVGFGSVSHMDFYNILNISFTFEWFYCKLISDPELPGSGMIFPDPNSARSFGSDRIRIHNTA
jgi:hypothetical protein